MKRIAAFYLLVLFPVLLFSQQETFVGTVLDKKNGHPLELVSVSLLAGDSSIVSYAYTDVAGRFEMKSARSARFMSCSSIGYKRLLLPLANFTNGMTINMEEAIIQIREVKITSHRIRQTKDTLTYSVSGFKMPQDRSIEDVLKKIPGIEVASNGTIKFQDRPISELYIEGMNLLDGKYALATRNIPAGMVKEVQVLQSHQSIAALRGKSFSDNAALNLSLDKGARNRLITLIDLGIGVGNHPDVLWDNRLMGMLFGKSMQNITMYKNNNIGNDIAAEIVPLAKSGIISQLSFDDDENLFASSASGAGNVDPSRYLFNDAHLVAINHLYRPRANTDLRLQLNALHNKETATHQSSTTYLYPSQTITVDENEQYAGQENRAEGEFSYILNDSSVYIKNTLKGMIGLHKSNLDLQINGKNTTESIHPQRKFLQDNFELIKNIGNHTFSIYSNNRYSELPQYMTITPGLYDELLNGGKAYESFCQSAALRSFHSDTYTYFQHQMAGVYLKYKAGVQYSNLWMTSQMDIDGTPLKESSLANNLSLETVKLYLEPSLNLKTPFWTIQFSIPFAYNHAFLGYKLPESRKQYIDRFLPMPKLNIKYELNAYWELTTFSTLSYQEPDIRKLYSGYLFTSYRSASAFEPELTYNKSLYNTLSLRFNNPLTGFFASLTGSHNLTWQELIYSYENKDKFLSLCHTYQRPHNSQFWSIRSRLSKAFSWSKLYTAIGASYSKQTDKILLENDLIPSVMNFVTLNFDFAMQPCRYINLEGKTSFASVKSLLRYEGSEPVSSQRFNHELNLNLIFSSHWKANLSNSLSHDNRTRKATYFADASVMYSHRLFDIELSVRNLFDHRYIHNVYISDFTSQTTNHTLRPREVLVKMMFSF